MSIPFYSDIDMKNNKITNVKIEGNLSGNAQTASEAEVLTNPRKISLTGAVSGNATFDGSSNVTIATVQANIATLTGNLPSDGTTLEVTINYPSGFNKDNSVVISQAAIRNPNTISSIYGFGTTFDSTSYVRGGPSFQVDLNSSNIRIRAKNIMITQGDSSLTGVAQPLAAGTNFGYRIVLLKV